MGTAANLKVTQHVYYAERALSDRGQSRIKLPLPASSLVDSYSGGTPASSDRIILVLQVSAKGRKEFPACLSTCSQWLKGFLGVAPEAD